MIGVVEIRFEFHAMDNAPSGWDSPAICWMHYNGDQYAGCTRMDMPTERVRAMCKEFVQKLMAAVLLHIDHSAVNNAAKPWKDSYEEFIDGDGDGNRVLAVTLDYNADTQSGAVTFSFRSNCGRGAYSAFNVGTYYAGADPLDILPVVESQENEDPSTWLLYGFEVTPDDTA
jgi:hypothetical protein